MVIVVIVLTTVIIFTAQSIKMDISAIIQVNILIIMSLATGNNYFSIWLYQPDLGVYKRMYIFN